MKLPLSCLFKTTLPLKTRKISLFLPHVLNIFSSQRHKLFLHEWMCQSLNIKFIKTEHNFVFRTGQVHGKRNSMSNLFTKYWQIKAEFT